MVDETRRAVLDALGILSKSLLILVAIVGLIRLAVFVDYDEVSVFILALLVAFFSLSVIWKTSQWVFKIGLCVIFGVAMVFTGLYLQKAAKIKCAANEVKAVGMLLTVGRALESWQEQGNPLPDCEWSCMTEKITEAGLWHGMTLQSTGENPSQSLDKIPVKDGWGCKFRYENLGGGIFLLKCSGPDRRFYSKDDQYYLSNTTPKTPLPMLPALVNWK